MESARLCICFVLLLCAASAYSLELNPNAEQFKSALREHLSTLQPANGFRGDNFRGQSTVGGFSPRRRDLKQAFDGDCYWNYQHDVCRVGFFTYVDLLEEVDSPVATYLHKDLACSLTEDKETCEDLECLWLTDDETCTHSIEDHHDFFETECAQNVSHLYDIFVWSDECSTLHTERRCTAEKMCAWYGSSCGVDTWYYFHNIDSEEALPEEVDELFGSRTTQLTLAVQNAIEDGDIMYAVDVADWDDAPPLVCPVDYEEVVCNYVDALTPYILQFMSCTLHDAVDCRTDPSCIYNFVDGCVPTEEVIARHVSEAEMELVRNIEDEDIREAHLLVLECQNRLSEDTCYEHDHCTWSDSDEYCHVSLKWEQEEIRRLVGDTEHDACKYLTIDLDSGCLDIEDVDECDAEEACTYIEDIDTCLSSMHYVVSFALSESEEALDDLEKAEKDCGRASTSRRCTAIDLDL